MVISKNFKIINEIIEEEIKPQAKIEISESEKHHISETLAKFFSSIKTLLREGAVLISPTEKLEPEEEFLEDPSLKNKLNSLHAFTINLLPQEKREAILSSVIGVKMDSELNFFFEVTSQVSQFVTETKEFLENAISHEIKNYAKELPLIMVERQEKLAILVNVMPEVKKYLENTKK